MKTTILQRIGKLSFGSLIIFTGILALSLLPPEVHTARQSPASLDMDTPGCGTTFGDPTCALSNSAEMNSSYAVTINDENRTVVTGAGQIVLTNSGELPTTVSNIAIILEKLHTDPGSGDAPGPSGKNWDILLTAVKNQFAACDGVAKTAYGDIPATPGASLVLSQNGQEIYLENVAILPLETPDADDDQKSCEDPLDGSDNDGDAAVDEDSCCEDPNMVVIDFEYEFDISDLGIEGPGDGAVSSDDDLRIDMIVTFGSGGKRGGTEEVDLNCDNSISGDDELYARSIQQRFSFDPLNCPEWIGFPGDIDGQVSYVDVLESAGTHLEVKAALPGMYRHPPIEMADGNTYTPISVPGSGIFEQSKPTLPVFGEWILIPNGTEIELEIDPGEPLVFDDIRLPPVQPLPPDSEVILPIPFTRDEEVYETDAYCPGIFAWLEPTKIMRGQQCTILWLYPYQFNPVQNRVSVFPDLSVKVLFNGEPDPIPVELKSDSFDAMKRRIAINSDAVIKAQDDNQGPIVPPYDEGPPTYGPYGWDYIILTASKFEQAANELAAWRKKTGFKTLVVKVPANWKANDIKTSLEGAYKNWGTKPKYILIIGDAEYVPCFYETWHPSNAKSQKKCDCSQCITEPPYRESYVGTDHYYTTMDGAGDLYPDIAIGRLSVDTLPQAMKRVNDIIEYEKNPVTDSLFYNHAAISTEFEDMNIKTDIYWNPTCYPDTYEDNRRAQSAEDLALFLEDPANEIEKEITRIYTASPNINPKHWSTDPKNFAGHYTSVGGLIPKDLWRSSNFKWDGHLVDILKALNSHPGLTSCNWTSDYTGQFLFVYRGHGGRDCWRAPYIDATDLKNSLDNCNRLPVVWSMACNTGWFDNETDFKKLPSWLKGEPLVDYTAAGDLSFSEQWERLESGGAIGIIASTRISFAYLNDLLFEGMVKAIWPEYKLGKLAMVAPSPILRMGDVLNFAKADMLNKAQLVLDPTDPVSKKKANCEAYHWFGDPATAIRMYPPNKILVADVPEEWPWTLNKKLFSVHVDWEDLYGNSYPLKDANVTITRADSDEYWEVKTDEEGNAAFPDFVAISSEEYDIVVTAPNSIPFQDTFTAMAAPSGGIILDSKVFSCASEIEIKVADANAGNETVDVIVSTSGGDEEKVLLEKEEATGMFVGTISTAAAVVEIEDGTLQVSDGQTISAEYFDEDDGKDGYIWVEATAVVDCQPPDFEGLRSATVDSDRVLLEWEAASDLHAPITYTIYRSEIPGLEIGTPIATTWALSYPDHDCEAGSTCYYVVRAKDAVDNEDDNTVEKSVTLSGTIE